MQGEIKTADRCRVCGNVNLTEVLSLGDMYVSDFLEGDADAGGFKAPLDLVLCDVTQGGCGLLQMRHTVSHEAMYRNYWYRSGVNDSMRAELADITAKVESLAGLRAGDHVLDIGSNDSTLLRSYVTPGIQRIGFEPATNIVEQYSREGVTKVINDFWNYEAWAKELDGAQAKVVTAIAMFYDLEDPNKFVGDVAKVLRDDGLFVIQMLYLPSFLERNAFDGICHEHLEYYSLSSLESLLKRHGLEVIDVEFRPVNEGSYRFFIRKTTGALATDPAGIARVKELRDKEEAMRLADPATYAAFAERVKDICARLTEFIKAEVGQGKKIYAYGASTKGNTLLQYCGLDHTLITAAAERNPDKFGKKTVGTGILIVSEEEARAAKPDYFLILPWHFLDGFIERERAYLASGGKFIVPLPEFKIIDKGTTL